MVSGMPTVDSTASAVNHLTSPQPNPDNPAVFADDLRHRAPVAQLAAKFSVLLHQQIEELPHGCRPAGKSPLQKPPGT